jgi:hypothetical protein
MSFRRFRVIQVLSLVGGLLANPRAPVAGAQEVRGRLLREADSAAIGDALIRLLDLDDRERARVATSPSGGFLLRGMADVQYRMRVTRVGFAPIELGPFVLHRDAARSITLYLPERTIELPELSTRSTRPACAPSLRDPALESRLLEAAQTALAIAEDELTSGRRRWAVEEWRRFVHAKGSATDSFTTVQPAHLEGWPVQSAPQDSLERHGFIKGDWPLPRNAIPGVDAGPTYLGPDARVLFSPWFLERHCFAIALPATGDDSTVTLRFSPAGGRGRDVLRGELAFDRQSLALRQLSWEYVVRPDWLVTRDRLGGSMRFVRLPDGAWMPRTWELRVVVPAVRPMARSYQLGGFRDIGGTVVRAYLADGSPDAAATAALAGRAADPPR